MTPALQPTLARLAGLMPQTLATMHGASFNGDCVAALNALGDHFGKELSAALRH